MKKGRQGCSVAARKATPQRGGKQKAGAARMRRSLVASVRYSPRPRNHAFRITFHLPAPVGMPSRFAGVMREPGVGGGEKGYQFGGREGATRAVTRWTATTSQRVLEVLVGCPAATFVALGQLPKLLRQRRRMSIFHVPV
jgi:hypothetical protein